MKGVREARQARLIHLDRRVLALQNGGRVLKPSLDLASQIDDCLDDAESWYSFTFDPQPAYRPDEYHDLNLRVARPGLTASSRTGFYDQPYYKSSAAEAAKRVTVEQLIQFLATSRGSSDGELARKLLEMNLTERLSSAKLLSLKAMLPGNKTRQAVIAMADASAFLELPAAEVAGDPAPSLAEQRQILTKTVDYLTRTIPRVPNFFATRTTVHYSETAANFERAGGDGSGL